MADKDLYVGLLYDVTILGNTTMVITSTAKYLYFNFENEICILSRSRTFHGAYV